MSQISDHYFNPNFILPVLKSNKSFHEVNTEYMFGATVDEVTYNNRTFPLLTCWFNNQAYHTAPISVNLMYNAMLQYMCPQCSIRVLNNPLPYKASSKRNVLYQGNSFGYQIAYNTVIAMSFVAGFYALFYLKVKAYGFYLDLSDFV